MKKVRLDISGLSYSQTQLGAYALLLSEKDGTRKLPIIIGGFEAQSIAIELEKLTPHRPLTHDLFKTFAQTFAVEITEVFIYNLVDGIFFSELICQYDGQDYSIDARTSDAIAIGLRFKVPIYTTDSILDAAGILLSEDFWSVEEESNDSPEPTDYHALSIQELETKLLEAINREDYELASKIRDEIKKRTTN